MGPAAGCFRGESVSAPVSRCKAVCAHPAAWVASVHLQRAETRCWPPCGPLSASPQRRRNFSVRSGQIYHAVISKGTLGASTQGSPEGPIQGHKGQRRIKAGVTSDARQVTSARSADRFKGFRDFLPRLLLGVSFGLKISEWRLFSRNPAVPTGWGGVYERLEVI